MADAMDYLEDIRFLFDAEQDTMTNETVEVDMEDYLEDIRFLFDAQQDTMDTDDYLEDIRFLFDEENTAEQDTASLDDDIETAAGDAKRVKGVEIFVQRLKKMKKGVKKFCTRFVQTVRRGFCCCVSVEE